MAQYTQFGALKTTGAVVLGGILTLGASVAYNLSTVADPGTTVNDSNITQYIERYSEDTGTASGSFHHVWAVDIPYTGTGVFHQIAFECDDWNNSINTDACISTSSTQTGSCIAGASLWTDVTVGTGTTKIISGATLPLTWPNDSFVLVATSTGASQSEDCKLRTYHHEHFEQ